MINETIGLEGLQISEVIRELRIDRDVSQEELYSGLCNKKVYFQFENGEAIMDELLSERLLSRLHVQYRLIDIMLNDESFWQKECRREISVQLYNKCWEKAEHLIDEYEKKVPQTELHRQYVLAKRAEILFAKGEEGAGKLFLEALELTMSVEELEKRLQGSGVISEEEHWMYMRYRNCTRAFSMEEYLDYLKKLEGWFPAAQMCNEVYFEVAYQCACKLCETEQYIDCREVCQTAITWLKRGIKHFHMAEFYFLDALTGMRLRHNTEQEKEFYQQCKMAYYVSLSFGEEEVAEKIAKQCEEEFGWHITKQVR